MLPRLFSNVGIEIQIQVFKKHASVLPLNVWTSVCASYISWNYQAGLPFFYMPVFFVSLPFIFSIPWWKEPLLLTKKKKKKKYSKEENVRRRICNVHAWYHSSLRCSFFQRFMQFYIFLPTLTTWRTSFRMCGDAVWSESSLFTCP